MWFDKMLFSQTNKNTNCFGRLSDAIVGNIEKFLKHDIDIKKKNHVEGFCVFSVFQITSPLPSLIKFNFNGAFSTSSYNL